jgi:hypothetical protein
VLVAVILLLSLLCAGSARALVQPRQAVVQPAE